MGHSDRYDDAFREIAAETSETQEIFERLALADVRDAADLLKPTFDETEGRDGFVSFELPASLAFDAQGSIDTALRLKETIDRENVLIKVPGTAEGVEAFEELTARGVNVNVTLLFAVERYREIALGEQIDSPRAEGASVYVGERGDRVLTALADVARAHQVPMAAVALRWLADQPTVVAPIASCISTFQRSAPEQQAMRPAKRSLTASTAGTALRLPSDSPSTLKSLRTTAYAGLRAAARRREAMMKKKGGGGGGGGGALRIRKD